MKLREVMIPNPVVISPDQLVKEAANILLEAKVECAPVINQNGSMIGFLTKDNICRMVGCGMGISTTVGEIMNKDFTTASPEENLKKINIEGFDGLPILDENGLVGIITLKSLLKAFSDSFWNVSNEFDAIINSTYNLIVSVDERGNIKVFNKSAEKLLEMDAEKVKGKKVIDVFPNSRLTEVVQSGNIETVQKIKLNNRYFISNRSPIEKDGKIIGAVAVLQDISELENVSKELKYVKELNEELDGIIESSCDGLYITDGNGITLRLNKAFEKMTGTNASICLGRHVDEIISKDGVVSESVTSKVLKTKKQITIIQKTKTGKTTLATGTPVFDEKGNIFRVVCNVRDITELSVLKNELEQARGLSHHYETELRTLRLQYAGPTKLVYNSNKMKELLVLVIRLAQVDSTTFLTGESGTGKELITEIIHNNSNRKDGPLIKVNCGAIPENLLESELFGYDQGAFTGAKKEGKLGYFELAKGGTLFLDEVGDLPFNLQVKLLRVLQNKEVYRVGGVKPVSIDVRIVAGTNRNLLEMVQNKEFREDLYYRLNVVPVNIPSLRERKEDIPALTAHFLHTFNRKYEMYKQIIPEVVDVFMDYNWPGNVRELENLIERLVVISPNDLVTKDDLPHNLLGVIRSSSSKVVVSGLLPLRDAVECVEKQIIEKAYSKLRTTREIAKVLEVDASTIVRKAAKYGIKSIK